MFDNLRRDAVRYKYLGGWFAHAGFWIVAVYRLGVWGHSLRNPLLRLPMRILYRLARLPFCFYNVTLWAGRRGARIGPGLCLIHPTNVMIGPEVEIGEDCMIFHDVTIATGPLPGKPKIGDRVDIYVGARVLGGVAIGEDSLVGANCVVTRNVPARSVVFPAQSRVIPRDLSPVARRWDARTGSGTEPASAAERAERAASSVTHAK